MPRKANQPHSRNETYAYVKMRRETVPGIRERDRAQHIAFRRAQRLLVIQKYGGKCACCGEARDEFLCIDHVNGGGNQHRRELRKSGGTTFYVWLKRNNFPPDFRGLCSNCNGSLGKYGYCPHERERATS